MITQVPYAENHTVVCGYKQYKEQLSYILHHNIILLYKSESHSSPTTTTESSTKQLHKSLVLRTTIS